MRVAVIVVSWNAATSLDACLAAYDAQDHDELEVVVVDNASGDDTAAVLDTALAAPRRHPLRVVRNDTNRGYAGAINDGLAATDAPVVVFSNVDVAPAPDLVSRALAALLADARRGSVQPKLLRVVPDRQGRRVVDTTGHVLTTARLVDNRGEGQPDDGRHDEPGLVFGVSGALAMHRRAMLEDVAWSRPDGRREVLNEDLFAYFEDVELDWRARLLGWDAWYEPSARALHERGGAGPRRTARVEALNWANRLLVVVTCDDARDARRHLPLLASTTALKLAELAVTSPRALPRAVGLAARGTRGALRRRRQLQDRAVVPAARVVGRWAVPFRYRPWVRTWWLRVRGRAPGVAPRRARSGHEVPELPWSPSAPPSAPSPSGSSPSAPSPSAPSPSGFSPSGSSGSGGGVSNSSTPDG